MCFAAPIERSDSPACSRYKMTRSLLLLKYTIPSSVLSPCQFGVAIRCHPGLWVEATLRATEMQALQSGSPHALRSCILSFKNTLHVLSTDTSLSLAKDCLLPLHSDRLHSSPCSFSSMSAVLETKEPFQNAINMTCKLVQITCG